jgi:hypothetical protein
MRSSTAPFILSGFWLLFSDLDVQPVQVLSPFLQRFYVLAVKNSEQFLI